MSLSAKSRLWRVFGLKPHPWPSCVSRQSGLLAGTHGAIPGRCIWPAPTTLMTCARLALSRRARSFPQVRPEDAKRSWK
jgi:hypothetical protein